MMAIIISLMTSAAAVQPPAASEPSAPAGAAAATTQAGPAAGQDVYEQMVHAAPVARAGAASGRFGRSCRRMAGSDRNKQRYSIGPAPPMRNIKTSGTVAAGRTTSRRRAATSSGCRRALPREASSAGCFRGYGRCLLAAAGRRDIRRRCMVARAGAWSSPTRPASQDRRAVPRGSRSLFQSHAGRGRGEPGARLRLASLQQRTSPASMMRVGTPQASRADTGPRRPRRGPLRSAAAIPAGAGIAAAAAGLAGAGGLAFSVLVTVILLSFALWRIGL